MVTVAAIALLLTHGVRDTRILQRLHFNCNVALLARQVHTDCKCTAEPQSYISYNTSVAPGTLLVAFRPACAYDK